MWDIFSGFSGRLGPQRHHLGVYLFSIYPTTLEWHIQEQDGQVGIITFVSLMALRVGETGA